MDQQEEILKHTTNRHYPLPERPWKYYQEWHDVVMLHYRADCRFLSPLLPEGLQPDLYDGTAWISLFAFSVKKMRPRFLPPLPGISSFNEINLRTYVMRDGIPGICMLSIEADKLADVLLSRWLLGLPYVKTEMKRKRGTFVAVNQVRNHYLDVKFYMKLPLQEKDRLDYWLTERHALYMERKKKLYRFDIHHREWELQEVKIPKITQNYTFVAAVSRSPDRQHFAKRLKVVIWGRKIVA